MEWPELRCDGARNGEYTRDFHGCYSVCDDVGLFYGRDGDSIVARTRKLRVLYMGARDYMGRTAMDGDGARHEYSRVFYQR